MLGAYVVVDSVSPAACSWLKVESDQHPHLTEKCTGLLAE